MSCPTSAACSPLDVSNSKIDQYQSGQSRVARVEMVEGKCGLALLDERLLSRGSGVVVANAGDLATVYAVRQHVVRRVEGQVGRGVITADAGFLWGCFADIGWRLGISRISGDPALAASQLGDSSEGAVVVVCGNFVVGSWDERVLSALSRGLCRGLFVVVAALEAGGVVGDLGRDCIDILGESPETARVWWEGVVEALVESGPPGSLASLERWWRGMNGLSLISEHAHSSLSVGARDLFSRLELARRSWPVARIDLLGSRCDLDELVLHGVVRLEQNHCVVDCSSHVIAGVSGDVSLFGVVGVAMVEAFSDDVWGRLRASVLLLDSGADGEAEAQFVRALELVSSTAQRRDLWSVWVSELGCRDADLHRGLAIRSAERALSMDDVDAALGLAGEARRGLSDPPFEAVVLMGQAHLSGGDIVSARVSFGKALDIAPDAQSRACSLSFEAEASFWAGELELAREYAEQAIRLGPSVSSLLRSRNVLGRLLLSVGKWEEAEASFAEDEALASSEHQLEALSRARANRAVALLSSGQLEAATLILESLLEDGRRFHRPRAVAIALSNLGVVAHLGKRYADALLLYEQAIGACHELGDRLGLVRPSVNLAELRLELGMVDEAEQVLRFARNAMRSGVPASIAPLMQTLEAEIHLARGNTSRAAWCAQSALRGATRSSNGSKLGECYRLIARIGLEDGNLVSVEEALLCSEQNSTGAGAVAEQALIRAKLARSRGEDACELAQRASSLARVCGDSELCRAAAVLEAEIAISSDDAMAARGHLRVAMKALHMMTDGLSPELVRSVYTRSDVRAMVSLQHALDRHVPHLQYLGSGRGGDVPVVSGYIGGGPRMQRLMAMVRRVAGGSGAPVLIHGESGTGKELIAEAIHQFSDRRDKPLVKVNCAALVDSLLLSELFGHEKGAFTGASGRKRGRFEVAEGGVLFLDEIGDISQRTQVALLRVLQDGTFERVGGTVPIHVDVRVVCATHRDLSRMVGEGSFREDLYYRLCGVVIDVPALRDRGGDILALSAGLLEQIARERKEPVKTLSARASELLMQHTWPGNVRELQNVLRAAALFADESVIEEDVLRDQMHCPATGAGAESPNDCALGADGRFPGGLSMGSPVGLGSRVHDPVDLAFESIKQGNTSLIEMKRRLERECIARALDETGGNITRAAVLLGMKRPRLSQIIKELGLQKGEV
ncbi:MAG: sigma 54-interacting transcriptional regulator [Polyangiaceae bacterium]|nr:sigma 54-interacting transcriptional regulator [Polyangiaceae bacterium]